MATSPSGLDVPLNSSVASCFCLQGSLLAATHKLYPGISGTRAYDEVDRIALAMVQHGLIHQPDDLLRKASLENRQYAFIMQDWNDAEDRTYADVVNVLTAVVPFLPN